MEEDPFSRRYQDSLISLTYARIVSDEQWSKREVCLPICYSRDTLSNVFYTRNIIKIDDLQAHQLLCFLMKKIAHDKIYIVFLQHLHNT